MHGKYIETTKERREGGEEGTSSLEFFHLSNSSFQFTFLPVTTAPKRWKEWLSNLALHWFPLPVSQPLLLLSICVTQGLRFLPRHGIGRPVPGAESCT